MGSLDALFRSWYFSTSFSSVWACCRTGLQYLQLCTMDAFGNLVMSPSLVFLPNQFLEFSDNAWPKPHIRAEKRWHGTVLATFRDGTPHLQRVYSTLKIWRFKPILSVGLRVHSHLSGGLRVRNHRAVVGTDPLTWPAVLQQNAYD